MNHRIEKYFSKKRSENNLDAEKNITKIVHEMEINILNCTLNKCIANIYSLCNYLEKNKIYTGNHELSRKILICLYPIVPNLAATIYLSVFEEDLKGMPWPNIDKNLLIENSINLPIQIKGKMVTTISTIRGYKEDEVLNSIYQLDKIKSRILDKKIIKVINVQDKIINIITN